MAQGPEELKYRLENIKAIQPMLEALRTISLSNWKYSLKKLELARKYLNSVVEIYNGLIAHDTEGGPKNSKLIDENPLVLAIGSNRGLCGNFNRDIADKLNQMIQVNPDGYHVAVMGERLQKIIVRKKITIHQELPLPNATDLTPIYASTLINQICTACSADNIKILFNTYRGTGKYLTILSPVFPNEFIKSSLNEKNLEDFIFDTSVKEMISALHQDLFELSIYFALQLSSAAEHSTRFQLMENASKNADNLSDELFLEVQALRRQKITEEMQELAVGAGLLNRTN